MTEESKKKKPKLSTSELNERDQCLKKLQEGGELERLKSVLYAQVMLQRSFKDSMQEQTREAVQRSGGISEITLDELARKLVKHGKQSVAPSIEADLKSKIRQKCFGA